MQPDLSIVIPTRDRRERLRVCLEALNSQTVPADSFEVIVVVDGSSDGTEEMLETLNPSYELRVVPQSQRGRGVARNVGLERARGRHVLFLDDDMVASPDLIGAHARTLANRMDVAVLGHIERRVLPNADRLARTVAGEWRNHYVRLAGRSPSFRDFYSGNVSLSREAVQRVGGFDVEMAGSEDIELGYRLSAHGIRFVYAPDAIGTEHNDLGWREIARDAELRGTQALNLYRHHPPMLPLLELGGYGALPRRWRLFRRVLLSLRVSSTSVAFAGLIIPGGTPSWLWMRFARSYSYWRGVRKAIDDRDEWSRLTGGARILMYHAIGRPGEKPSRYIVPLQRFERQMVWLKRLRYTPISLEHLCACRSEYRLPPVRSVVLTFDDGYVDNLDLAFPVLARLGLPATIFLVTGRSMNDWDGEAGELRGRPLMSLDEARQLSPPLAVGAHTRTHPVLTAVPAHQAEAEAVGSRADLERALERPVRTFAYPYGKVSAEVQSLVAKAGFACALTVAPGRNHPSTNAYALHRLEVRGTHTLARFILTLWLGDTHALLRSRRAKRQQQ